MKTPKATATTPIRRQRPLALAALKRASKDAIELARRTGTPAWIMVDGKLVDATKLRKQPAKKRRRS